MTRARGAWALAIAAAIAGLVVGIMLAGTGGVPHPPRPVQFGASVNLLFNSADVEAGQIDAQLSALEATGATLARTDALWERSEPAPPAHGVHRYDWSFDDLIAAALAAHRLRWLPIVDYSAAWAQSIPGQDHSPPRSDLDYAAYAGALAARYGSGGTFWRQHPQLPDLPVQELEIWNEPDSAGFWVPRPDPARYARLYLAARAAIRSVDPTARALIGGLTDAPRFMPELIAADPALRGRIDGVAIHPYAATPEAVIARVAAARSTLNALGLGSVPLYVTEFGWTTSPPGALNWLAASVRPTYIARTVEGLAAGGCMVDAAILYTWYSPRRDPHDSQQWFGISPPGAAGSRAVSAFTAGLRRARRSPARILRCG